MSGFVRTHHSTITYSLAADSLDSFLVRLERHVYEVDVIYVVTVVEQEYRPPLYCSHLAFERPNRKHDAVVLADFSDLAFILTWYLLSRQKIKGFCLLLSGDFHTT